MKPKQLIEKWVRAFNNADVNTLVSYYADNAINHQVVNDPVVGKEAIRKMFTNEFAQAKMVCNIENIFEDGEWAILEWKDPMGLRVVVSFLLWMIKFVFSEAIGTGCLFRNYMVCLQNKR